jgi:hypothetical protein
MIWDTWKKGFDAWENATAKVTEQVLKSPVLLAPMGTLLGKTMKAKASYDKVVAGCVGTLGMATKRDQERTLHTLNQLESRLLDLEERLADAQQKKN